MHSGGSLVAEEEAVRTTAVLRFFCEIGIKTETSELLLKFGSNKIN